MFNCPKSTESEMNKLNLIQIFNDCSCMCKEGVHLFNYYSASLYTHTFINVWNSLHYFWYYDHDSINIAVNCVWFVWG